MPQNINAQGGRSREWRGLGATVLLTPRQCTGICLDILKTQWSPALYVRQAGFAEREGLCADCARCCRSIIKVLLSISSLLSDPNPRTLLILHLRAQVAWSSRADLSPPPPPARGPSRSGHRTTLSQGPQGARQDRPRVDPQIRPAHPEGPGKAIQTRPESPHRVHEASFMRSQPGAGR